MFQGSRDIIAVIEANTCHLATLCHVIGIGTLTEHMHKCSTHHRTHMTIGTLREAVMCILHRPHDCAKCTTIRGVGSYSGAGAGAPLNLVWSPRNFDEKWVKSGKKCISQ